MDGFIGEVRLFAGNFAPLGWLFCDGTVYSGQAYGGLYAILGNIYGGNAQQQTFGVPDLRGRVPMGAGTGTGLSPRPLGVSVGNTGETLTLSQMPSHSHDVKGRATPLSTTLTNDPKGNLSTDTAMAVKLYTNNAPNVIMGPNAVSAFMGGNAAHNNIQPCVGINHIICWDGYFPPFDN